MATKYCDCRAWKISWPQIESAQILAWTHGNRYTGTAFKFCPWCGQKLKKELNDE